MSGHAAGTEERRDEVVTASCGQMARGAWPLVHPNVVIGERRFPLPNKRLSDARVVQSPQQNDYDQERQRGGHDNHSDGRGAPATPSASRTARADNTGPIITGSQFTLRGSTTHQRLDAYLYNALKHIRVTSASVGASRTSPCHGDHY